MFLFFRTFSGRKISSVVVEEEQRKLSLKLLFLNKCFSHQSYCWCVLKTPAVWGFGISSRCDKGTKENCFPAARFSETEKFPSCLLCKTQRNSSQMISIFLARSLRRQFTVPNSYLSAVSHDAFENNLMMVRILSLSKRIYRFLSVFLRTFLSPGHEFLS